MLKWSIGEIVKWMILILLILSHNTFSQSIDSTLHKAYNMNSQILLDEFFINWEKSNKLTEEQKLEIEDKIENDDTLKEVYNIADTYYKGATSEAKYNIIYDTLKYQVCKGDTIELFYLEPYSPQKISNYRLEEKFIKQKILYFGHFQNMNLADFFKSDFDGLNYDSAKSDYVNKRLFLKNNIKFYNDGRLGMHYSYNNFISGLSTIILSKNLKQAFVYITENWSVNGELWQKSGDNWKYIKTLFQASH